MKTWFAAFALAVALLMGGTARAEMKIVTVDFNRAMNEVEEGKKALDSLETVLAPRRTELEDKQRQLQNLQAEYEKQAAILSPDAKAKKEQELRERMMALQQLNLQAQDDAARMFNQINEDLKAKLQAELARLAKTKGWDLVIEQSLIMYQGTGMDVTDELIKAYNAASAAKK